MTLTDAFRGELARSAERSPDPDELLPDRLAQACVAVLPFDGAGLTFSILVDRRLPWGASDPMAATAERLQFALGEGPCVAAHRDHAQVLSSWAELQARWPVYAAQLAQRTSYRCVLALPVAGPLSGVGVLTLYRTRPGPPADDLHEEVQEVSHAVGEALVESLGTRTDTGGVMPMTLRGPPVVARQQVWMAIGYLSASRSLTSSAGLALLRAMAFTDDTDLETMADRVLSGEMTE